RAARVRPLSRPCGARPSAAMATPWRDHAAALRWVTVLLALLSGCSTLVPLPAGPTPAPPAAHAAWARVLAKHVDAAGEVDFPALASDRADLDSYVRHVAQVPLQSVPGGPLRLAHMINAYNALSMYNVLESGTPASLAGWAKLEFFVLRKFDVGGHAM